MSKDNMTPREVELMNRVIEYCLEVNDCDSCIFSRVCVDRSMTVTEGMRGEQFPIDRVPIGDLRVVPTTKIVFQVVEA